MRCKEGFTLIELLVVISIISLLSSVVLSSLNSARARARDARRAEDMNQIMVALNLFYDKYGCLPMPGSAACTGTAYGSDAGGWDYSSQGNFMSFLEASGVISKVPVDPVNNMTGDSAPSGTFSYRYYCYSPSFGSIIGLHLGYWSESSGTYIMKNVQRNSNWADDTYTCK